MAGETASEHGAGVENILVRPEKAQSKGKGNTGGVMMVLLRDWAMLLFCPHPSQHCPLFLPSQVPLASSLSRPPGSLHLKSPPAGPGALRSRGEGPEGGEIGAKEGQVRFPERGTHPHESEKRRMVLHGAWGPGAAGGTGPDRA